MLESAERLDIVSLIDKNPLTRLTKTNNERLLGKLQSSFSTEQQRFYTASFYCFLNHNPYIDFVVDFDDTWHWLGFGRKDSAKAVLLRNFVEDVDYKIVHPRSSGKGGVTKEQIMLSVQTFKYFCMLARTEKAAQIRLYFVKLESIVHETVREQEEDLARQLTVMQDKLDVAQNHLSLKQTEFNMVKRNLETIKHKRNYHKFKKGNCFYVLKDTWRVKTRFKVGKTNDINVRLAEHRVEMPNLIVLVILFTNSNSIVETLTLGTFDRSLNNSEYIENTTIDDVLVYLRKLVKLNKLAATFETELYKYNELIIDDESDDVADTVTIPESLPAPTVEDSDKSDSEDEELIFVTKKPAAPEKEFSENALTRFGKKKFCNTCNKEQLLRCFFYIDKEGETYYDQCKTCYDAENGKSKQCSKCKEIKSTSLFTKEVCKTGGFSYSCRECHRKTVSLFREKTRLKNKAFSLRECAECKSSFEIGQFFKYKTDSKEGVKIQTFWYTLSNSCKSCYEKAHGPSKQCVGCEEIKPLTAYGADKRKPDGICIYCKDCRRKERRKPKAPASQASTTETE